MFPLVRNLEEQKGVLTLSDLVYLGVQGRKASETYAEWLELPTKRSAGHYNLV